MSLEREGLRACPLEGTLQTSVSEESGSQVCCAWLLAEAERDGGGHASRHEFRSCHTFAAVITPVLRR